MEPFSTTPIKHSSSGGDSFRNKTEPWKPLDCLAEVAKSFKSSPQNPVIKAELISAQNGEANICQTRLHKFKIKEEKNDIIQMSSVAAKSKRLQGINGKQKGTMSSSQAPIDATTGPCDRRICPIWFQLIASLNQLWSFLLWRLYNHHSYFISVLIFIHFNVFFSGKEIHLFPRYQIVIWGLSEFNYHDPTISCIICL